MFCSLSNYRSFYFNLSNVGDFGDHPEGAPQNLLLYRAPKKGRIQKDARSSLCLFLFLLL